MKKSLALWTAAGALLLFQPVARAADCGNVAGTWTFTESGTSTTTITWLEVITHTEPWSQSGTLRVMQNGCKFTIEPGPVPALPAEPVCPILPVPSGDIRGNSLTLHYPAVSCSVDIEGAHISQESSVSFEGTLEGNTLRFTVSSATVFQESFPDDSDVPPLVEHIEVTGSGTAQRKDYIIDHIEVVQAVQDAANSVPLVAGKSAEVRVFTALKDAAADTPPDTNVPVTLQIGGGETLTNAGFGTLTTAHPDREKSNHSHNFYVPKEQIKAGTLTLRAVVNPDKLLEESDYDNNEYSLPAALNVQARRNLDVWYMPLCIQPPGGSRVCPASIPGTTAFLSKIAPAADDAVAYRPFLAGAPTYFKALAADYKLIWWLRSFRLHRLAANSPDQLVAWLPLSQAPPIKPHGTLIGLSDPPFLGGEGHVAWIADKGTPGGPSQTLAHEIGHNLGLRHPTPVDNCARDGDPNWPWPNGRINEIGWDVSGGGLMPRLKYDFMCYQGASWMSAYHYNQLFQGDFVPPRAAAASAQSASLALVGGSLRRDGTGARLDPIYWMEAGAQPSASQPDGEFCLEFRDAPGTALASHCFDLAFFNPETSQDLEEDGFTFVVSIPAGVTQVALLRQGHELTSVRASAHAPSVAIASPSAGQSWDGAGGRTVSWTGSDADGDPLFYSLLYSSDGGTSWTPLAIDLTTTTYTFDSAAIQGGAQVYFRVEVSDGFHSASAAAGPIAVVQQPAIRVDGPINLGAAMAGTARALEVPIVNDGSGPLTVTSIVSSAPVFQVQGPPVPLVIPAGASVPVQMLYTPARVGTDTGTLTFASNAAGNPTLQVAIEGRGTDGQTPSIRLERRAISFSETAAGQTADASTRIRNSSAVNLQVRWSVQGNGFRAASTPASFTLAGGEEQDIAIRFAPQAAGAFSGKVIVTSNDPDESRIEIALAGNAYAASASPQINAGGVVDAAAGRPVVAPGGIASLYGSNLAGQASAAEAVPLPRESRDVQVLVNGIAAPLFYVSPGQINFQMPFEIAPGGDARVTVVRNGLTSNTVTVACQEYAPAIFVNPAAGEPIVQRDADYSVIGSFNPVRPRDLLTVYVNGIGGLTTAPATGAAAPVSPLAEASAIPTVTVAGIAVTVRRAALTPHLVGVGQVAIELPSPLPSGPLSLVIRFGDSASQSVTLPR